MNRFAAAVAVLPLLLITGCGGSNDSGSPGVAAQGPANAQTVTVESNDKLQFVPETITAKVGTLTLTDHNVGKIPHNLVFDPESLGQLGSLAGGASKDLTLTFDKAGTFTFMCTFHSGMKGKVVVS